MLLSHLFFSENPKIFNSSLFSLVVLGLKKERNKLEAFSSSRRIDFSQSLTNDSTKWPYTNVDNETLAKFIDISLSH